MLWRYWWNLVYQLRPACSRTRTFLWMVTVLAGMTVRSDYLGVTSIVRALGLRPIYHQKEARCDGHIFITTIAYHLLHTIRFKLRQRGVRFCWTTIRKQLSTQVRITTTMKRKDNKVVHIRKSSKAEPSHQVIYDALNLSYQPGRIVKTVQ